MLVPRVQEDEITRAMERMQAKQEPQGYVLDEVPTYKATPITQTEYHKNRYVTHTKHTLTHKEARFIDAFMACGDPGKAVEEAGYTVKAKTTKGNTLLKKDYIADEIAYRTQLYQNAQIADRQEILAFYTAVMRGQVKDQFDLDATLRDRLDAGEKLAKRIIDNEEKKNVQAQQVVVNIDFNRDDKEEQVIDIQQLSD